MPTAEVTLATTSPSPVARSVDGPPTRLPRRAGRPRYPVLLIVTSLSPPCGRHCPPAAGHWLRDVTGPGLLPASPPRPVAGHVDGRFLPSAHAAPSQCQWVVPTSTTTHGRLRSLRGPGARPLERPIQQQARYARPGSPSGSPRGQSTPAETSSAGRRAARCSQHPKRRQGSRTGVSPADPQRATRPHFGSAALPLRRAAVLGLGAPLPSPHLNAGCDHPSMRASLGARRQPAALHTGWVRVPRRC